MGQTDEAGREVETETPPEKAAPCVSPDRKASTGFVGARKTFRTAFERLRKREQKAAEKAAQAHVASEVEQIRQADEFIVKIAQHLPEGLRKRIAEVRRVLTAKIMTLDPTMHGRAKSGGLAKPGAVQ